MSKFQIAFYKGTHAGLAGVYNRLVRWRGNGPYSHVEVIFSDGMSASSSFMDKGVRFKKIDYDPKNWDILDLPAHWEADARAWFEKNKGAKYDVMGNVFLAVGFFSDSADKYFCSEAVAAALNIGQSFRLEPNTLYPIVEWMMVLDVASNPQSKDIVL